MKKVTLTDLNGKEIEVYFADDKTVASAKHSDNYEVKIEDVPTDKNWAEFTGGTYDDPDHPLNKHDEGQMYNMNEMNVNEGSAGEGAHENFYQKLDKAWTNKIKQLQQPESQIKIDDTIPSDFLDLSELRNGAIYKVANLNLIAKLVSKQFDDYSALLKMKRHGTVFYVEEGSLMKATDLEVESYLEESN